MSDDKNLTENPDQVVDVPEVIDTDPINSNDPAEMLEVSGIESSVDESEPEAGINSFGAIAGKGLNEKISASAPEELEEIDTEMLEPLQEQVNKTLDMFKRFKNY
jgi:hypothetical protein